MAGGPYARPRLVLFCFLATGTGLVALGALALLVWLLRFI